MNDTPIIVVGVDGTRYIERMPLDDQHISSRIGEPTTTTTPVDPAGFVEMHYGTHHLAPVNRLASVWLALQAHSDELEVVGGSCIIAGAGNIDLSDNEVRYISDDLARVDDGLRIAELYAKVRGAEIESMFDRREAAARARLDGFADGGR